VVLQGESGTGKELFARAIHNLSERRQGPLVAVNCAALPDTLLESELFGHVAGAFTDARQDRKGRFGEADGGTLFLDEIGDISPKLQVKLLRVLEEHSFQPVGSSKTVTVDVRLVAATNKDLARLVEQGTFRQDLFYRLNVLMLELPALRERKEDIALLVDHFIMRFNEVQGKNITAVAPEAMRLLMQHDFPGNVRELANIIERAFVLCTGTVILPDHLPDHLRGRPAPPPAGSAPIGSAQPVSATDDSPAVSANGLQTKSLPQNPSSPNSLEEMEAQFIRDALIRNRGNKAQTARELGIHKTTLWRKMKRLEIPPDTGSRTS
jgi:transcriptional regulator with PAS, ATPase and Fis domain